MATATPAASAAPAAALARARGVLAPAGRGLVRAWRVVAGVVRPATWVLIALTVLLWIGGEILGWRELVVAAVVLTVLIGLCALMLIGRSTYDIGLDLHRSRVVVGERAVGALTLGNTGGRALRSSRVVLPVGAGRGVFGVPRLSPGASVEELFAIPTSRRGVLQVGPVSVLRGDPLGLFERAHHRDAPVDLFVHPKTVGLQGRTLGFLRDLEGLTTRELAPDDVAFHALREYRPGDDLRHVHWRSSARTGRIMVRQYEQTRRSHFIVALSTLAADYTEPAEFELAVSIAGSVALRALADARRVDVHVQGRTLPAPNAPRMLDALAALGPSPRRDGGLEDLAGAIAATVPQASVVVLVGGGTVDAARLRTACARLPYGSRVLTVRAHRGAESSLRRIGDASVVTVGTLEDLPAAVSKVLA